MTQNDKIRRQRAPSVTLGLLEYLWAILVVLNGNSVYHACLDKDYFLLELCCGMTWLLLVAEMVFRRIRPKRNSGVLTVSLLLYCLCYLAVRQSNIAVTDYICLFLIGLPGLVLLFSLLHEHGLLLSLFRKLFDVIVILAAISLYYWIFGILLRIIPANTRVLISWGTVRYVTGFDGLQFVTQLDTTFFPDQFIYRNSGIFTEAPMFNLWLDIALAGELFLKERPSKLRVTLLSITILTTMSTTGILFLGMCFVIHILQERHRMDRSQRLLVVVGGLILLPVLAGVAIYTIVLKSDTQSYMMRLSDYVAGVKLWWDYPIFGSGYADLKSLLPYIYSPDGVLGFSNSLTAVLGTGGLWMALLFYVPQIGMLFPKVTKDPKLSCFAICDLFLFCTTLYIARFIGVVLLAFAIVITLGKGKKMT